MYYTYGGTLNCKISLSNVKDRVIWKLPLPSGHWSVCYSLEAGNPKFCQGPLKRKNRNDVSSQWFMLALDHFSSSWREWMCTTKKGQTVEHLFFRKKMRSSPGKSYFLDALRVKKCACNFLSLFAWFSKIIEDKRSRWGRVNLSAVPTREEC